MASMTDYLKDALRDHVLLNTPYTPPATVQLGLFTTATSEVTGGSYARQPVTFEPSGTGTATSTGDVTFDAMPATTVTYAALFDNLGNMLLSGPIDTPRTVAAGAPLLFAAGDIDATFT